VAPVITTQEPTLEPARPTPPPMHACPGFDAEEGPRQCLWGEEELKRRVNAIDVTTSPFWFGAEEIVDPVDPQDPYWLAGFSKREGSARCTKVPHFHQFGYDLSLPPYVPEDIVERSDIRWPKALVSELVGVFE
jgi:hypothetical protein